MICFKCFFIVERRKPPAAKSRTRNEQTYCPSAFSLLDIFIGKAYHFVIVVTIEFEFLNHIKA